MESLAHNHTPESQPTVDYLDQPFAVGDMTPSLETKRIAETVHGLPTPEKLEQLHKMDETLKKFYNPQVKLIPAMREELDKDAIQVSFSHPAADTSPQEAAPEKPTHNHKKIFVAP